MTDCFWRVEMDVSGGLYIVLPDSYRTREAAEASITPALRDVCRAMLYKTGRGQRPVRADDATNQGEADHETDKSHARQHLGQGHR